MIKTCLDQIAMARIQLFKKYLILIFFLMEVLSLIVKLFFKIYVIFIQMHFQDSPKILIKLVDDTTGIEFQIKVPNNFTLQDIKREIQYQSCIPVPEQFLVFNKKPLKKDETINKQGLTNGSLLHIQRVEYKGTKDGAQFCNLANRKESGVYYSTKVGPRTLYPGLMLEIVCKNPNCKQGFGKNVLVSKKFGKFNICSQIYSCVCHLCGEESEQPAFNMGFYLANAQIRGKRNSEKEKVNIKITAEGQKYQTFEYKGKQKSSTFWNFLQANVEALK